MLQNKLSCIYSTLFYYTEVVIILLKYTAVHVLAMTSELHGFGHVVCIGCVLRNVTAERVPVQ